MAEAHDTPEAGPSRQGDEISGKAKWLVIGLGGVSGGGKTTLANFLLTALPTTVVYLGQDEYILPDGHPAHPPAPGEVGGVNKDTIQSINMVKMLADVDQILNSDPATIALSDPSGLLARENMIGRGLPDPRPPPWGNRQSTNHPPVLVLDGFLLYADYRVLGLCNRCYFITLDVLECWNRRRMRTFTGNNSMGTALYFEHCMWPSYMQQLGHAEMLRDAGIVDMLDGTISMEQLRFIVYIDAMYLLNDK